MSSQEIFFSLPCPVLLLLVALPFDQVADFTLTTGKLASQTSRHDRELLAYVLKVRPMVDDLFHNVDSTRRSNPPFSIG